MAEPSASAVQFCFQEDSEIDQEIDSGILFGESAAVQFCFDDIVEELEIDSQEIGDPSAGEYCEELDSQENDSCISNAVLGK